jgi:GWxTD domain-containing protein
MALLMHSCALLSQSPTPGANSKSNKKRVLRVEGQAAPFKAWLEQDVVWIITPEEKAAFKSLQNDEERDQFVEAFWWRRDPTPDTYENEFKVEHYRRIVYANDHFAAQGPGWESDRGRIYIVYGPPDHVTTFSAQDARPPAQDGQNYNGLPSETWSYRYLEGVGLDVVIDFVDICSCGDYRMRMPDELRDALLFIPEVGVIEKKLKTIDAKPYLIEVVSPVLKFRDLEARLDSKPKVRALPIELKTEVAKATDVTSIVNITISFQKSDMTPRQTEAFPSATLNVVGRVKTLTGHVVELFEDEVIVNQSSSPDLRVQKSIPLLNAHYRLEIAAEIAHTEKATTWTGILNVRP